MMIIYYQPTLIKLSEDEEEISLKAEMFPIQELDSSASVQHTVRKNSCDQKMQSFLQLHQMTAKKKLQKNAIHVHNFS